MIAFLDWLSFDGLVKALHDAAVGIYQWFRDMIWSYLGTIFGALGSVIATVGSYLTLLASCLGSVAPYFAFANAWVPVDVFFQLVAAYCSFWLGWVTYRVVKSWIPTVSGGG